jgi:uncharacterized protein
MAENAKPLAVITGASTGIGYELARCAVEQGFDLVVAADEPQIEEAASALRRRGGRVSAVVADLAEESGVDKLLAAIRSENRPVEVLIANAGRGLGNGFLDQEWREARRVIDTNVTGTLYFIHAIAREMRNRGAGRILVTGSIAGFMPGTFQAVYNGTKAFLNSFSLALRHELKGSGVSVTCLMPGGTETEFFKRAGMTDTKIGAAKKDDPAAVARQGFAAMMKGQSEMVTGWRNKLQSTAARILPADMTAELHRSKAGPGTAKMQRGRYVTTTGVVVGGLAAAALATWYGLGRRRASAPWRVRHHPAPARLPLPHDRSGWGRAG